MNIFLAPFLSMWSFQLVLTVLQMLLYVILPTTSMKKCVIQKNN